MSHNSPSGPIGPPRNPQDDEMNSEANSDDNFNSKQLRSKSCERHTQTDIKVADQKLEGTLQKEEMRQAGCVKTETYTAYLRAIGCLTILALILTITGIMLAQQLVSMWQTYWIDDKKEQ